MEKEFNNNDAENDLFEPKNLKNSNSPESIPAEKTIILKHGKLVVISITVLLIVILIGLFFWHNQVNNAPQIDNVTPERPSAEVNQEPESTTARAQTDSFNAMSNSDEINTIEADLESTNLNSLDAEITAIEAELEAVD